MDKFTLLDGRIIEIDWKKQDSILSIDKKDVEEINHQIIEALRIVNKKTLLDVVHSNGYTKHFHGYRKITENYTHWITLYVDNIDMYCYRTDDKNMENVYLIGMFKVDEKKLQVLIDIFSDNYK